MIANNVVEPEIAYCDLDENMDWAEKLIKYVLNNIILECNDEFELLNKDVNKLKSFVYKTIVIVIAVVVIFEFTVGSKINEISWPQTEAIKMGINLFMVTSVNMTSTAKMTPAIGELKIADTAAAAPHPIIRVLFL